MARSRWQRDDPPEIEFIGEFTIAQQESLRAAVDSTVLHFAERFAVGAPNLTVRYYSGNQTDVACGQYSRSVVSLTARCAGAIAHEYSHALQDHVRSGFGANPAWITEGVANRWSAQYYDAIGSVAYDTHIRETVLPQARKPLGALESMETYDVLLAEAGAYSLAHLAIDWMVTLTGDEETLFDFYLQRSSYLEWQDAFRDVFDIEVADFYESFAAHRAQVAARLPTIRGVVLGPDGEPAAGVRVRGSQRSGQRATSTETTEDGAFILQTYEGSLVLAISTESADGRQHSGWYGGASGFTPLEEQATILVVEDEDLTGITIRLPELHRITGIVLGPDGQPAEGATVYAFGATSEPTLSGSMGTSVTFSLLTPGGSYRLALYTDSTDGREHIGWYSSEAGLVSPRGQATILVVEDEDLTGITIHLPERHRITGIVLGPDGQPAEGNTLIAFGAASEPTLSGSTGTGGTFSLLTPGGSYRLALYTDSTGGREHIGWYGGEDGFTSLEEQATLLVVDDEDLTGITIRLPEIRRITGIVLGSDGQPAEGATVYAFGAASEATLSDDTDATGTFNLLTTGGSYRLDVYANPPGGRLRIGSYGGQSGIVAPRAQATILVVEDEDLTDIVIRLPTLHRIAGVVLGPDGRPVEGLRLWMNQPHSGVLVTTGPDGTFSRLTLGGSYRIEVWVDGQAIGWYRRGSLTSLREQATVLVADDGDLTGVTIRLPEIRRIAGVAIGPDGQPVEGVHIDGVGTGSDATPRDTTGTGGTFNLLMLGGSYRLKLYVGAPDDRRYLGWYAAEGGLTWQREQAAIFVVDNEDLTDVALHLPGRIAGRVLGPDGQPMEGVRVSAYGGSGVSVLTGPDGTFTLIPVGGTYRLRLSVDFPDGRQQVRWYAGESGLVLQREQATLLVVDDENFTNIVMRLPEVG